MPHRATSPLATSSSAQEAIPFPYLIHKNVKNLLAVWHGAFSSDGGKESSAWDNYAFLQKRTALLSVSLNKVLKHIGYLTFATMMLAAIVPSLQE